MQINQDSGGLDKITRDCLLCQGLGIHGYLLLLRKRNIPSSAKDAPEIALPVKVQLPLIDCAKVLSTGLSTYSCAARISALCIIIHHN